MSLAILRFMFSTALASGELFAQSVGPSTFDTRPVVIKRMVTQGLAKTVNENLFQCEVPLRNYRRSAVGTITADNGRVLTVPAQTAYLTGPKLSDLFNECDKTTPAKLTVAARPRVRRRRRGRRTHPGVYPLSRGVHWSALDLVL